jgi:hypothetical protein
MTAPVDERGVPYLGWQTCAMISCRVVNSVDLGSHTLFIAEIEDAKLLSEKSPLTYADYQAKVKPKAEKPKTDDRRIVGFRCKICKYEYKGNVLPEDFTCPLCGHGAEDFEPIFE